MTHGHSGYAHGCRCASCHQGHRDYMYARAHKDANVGYGQRRVDPDPGHLGENYDITPLEEAVLAARGYLASRPFSEAEIVNIFNEARGLALEAGEPDPGAMTRKSVVGLLGQAQDKMRVSLAQWRDVACG